MEKRKKTSKQNNLENLMRTENAEVEMPWSQNAWSITCEGRNIFQQDDHWSSCHTAASISEDKFPQARDGRTEPGSKKI